MDLQEDIIGPETVKSNENLELSAPSEVTCYDSVEYKWVCSKSTSENGTYTECPDPDTIFGSYSSSADSITLTPENYDSEQYLKIELYFKVDENEGTIDKIIYVSSFLDVELADSDLVCSIQLFANIDESESSNNNAFEWVETSSDPNSDLGEFL
mmetsp:Transcript_28755/g.25872  ORF Transcript_28755/g.25872 Transcript_28755/m.25872 type:complete len:155 (+) Transcript_28755:965-1429(+)